MTPEQQRKAFQRIKGMSNDKFWAWMNFMHSQAYFAAVKHYNEAAEIILPPRLQKQLHDKATEIRETWDGMNMITMDETEGMDLQNVMKGDRENANQSSRNTRAAPRR